MYPKAKGVTLNIVKEPISYGDSCFAIAQYDTLAFTFMPMARKNGEKLITRVV